METIHIVKKDLDSKTKLLKEVKCCQHSFNFGLNKHVVPSGVGRIGQVQKSSGISAEDENP